MDKLQYAYTKRRSDFGRASSFVDRATELDVNVLPHSELASQFMRRNPVDVKCEDGLILSEHETNTNYTELESVGMNHTEGGWPKDISPSDIDQTTRYRRKAEKEEAFIAQVSRISQEMEHCILQSNAVDIYQKYFDDDCLYRDDPPVAHAKVINNYRDPTDVARPVSQVVWHPDGPGKIAVAHCVLTFQGHTPQTSLDCYIWRTEDISSPELVLSPSAPVLCLQYNPKDQSVLAGGQYNGQVVIWDLRKGNRPAEQTALPVSHRDPVYDVTWIQSKAGTECFSISTDGQVLWWDVRSLDQPLDQMYIDASRKNDPKLAEGGTCLEYDITAPTKFMVGTEQGNVFACSRRAKTPGEKVVAVYSGAQLGPIYALRRNPMYTKYFLTVGDWTAKIWSEDCKDSPLLWTTKYSSYLTDGCWSPTRPSVFFVTKMDGTFDIWDLMFRQKSAEYSVKVSDDAIQCMSVQEQGQMVCVGTNGGVSVILQLSEGLVALQRNEKLVFSSMLERETKREKILEGREREKKLLQKKMLEDEDKKATTTKPAVDALDEANKAFFDIIDKEKARLEKENNKFSKFERVVTTVTTTVPAISRSQTSVTKSMDAFKIEEEESEQGSKSAWAKTPQETPVQVQVPPIVTIIEPPPTEAASEAAPEAAADAAGGGVHATVSSRKEDPSVEQLSGPSAEVTTGKGTDQPEAEISHQPEPDEMRTVDDHRVASPISGEANAFEGNLAPTPVVVVIEEPEEEKAEVNQTPEAAEKDGEEPLPLSPVLDENSIPVPDIIMEENATEEATTVKSVSFPVPNVVITDDPEPTSHPEFKSSDVSQKPSSTGEENDEQPDKVPEAAQDSSSSAPQDDNDDTKSA